MTRKLSFEEQEKVMANQGLVRKIVLRYLNIGEFDDLVSIGNIGLIKAVTSFDPSRNSNFGTYAGMCIRNEILMYNRHKESTEINAVSLFSPYKNKSVGSDAKDISLIDSIFYGNDIEIADITTQYDLLVRGLSIIFNLLEYREREIILYTIAGYYNKEIAPIFGISTTFVNKILRKSIISKINNSMKLDHYNKKYIITYDYKTFYLSFYASDIEKVKVHIESKINTTNSIHRKVVNYNYDDGKVIIQFNITNAFFLFLAEIFRDEKILD